MAEEILDKKTSELETLTRDEAIAANAVVPVAVPGIGNGKIALKYLKDLLYDAGQLTDSASIDVPNNALSTLNTTQSTLTLNVDCADGEVPNCVVEIRAGAAITLTVTKTVGNTTMTLFPSEAGGTSLKSGKYYQFTCVGNCWTIAEFVTPNVQRSVVVNATPETRSMPEDAEELGKIEPNNELARTQDDIDTPWNQ